MTILPKTSVSIFLLALIVAMTSQRLLQTVNTSNNCNTEVCATGQCTTLPSGILSCNQCKTGTRVKVQGLTGTDEAYYCETNPCLTFYDKDEPLFGGCNNCKDGFGKDEGVEANTKIHYGCLTLVTPIDGCLNYKTPSQCALCEKDYFLKDTEVCERLVQAERIINCDFHKWDHTLLVCMKCSPGYTLNFDKLLKCEATTPENEGCSFTINGLCGGCDRSAGYVHDDATLKKGFICKKNDSPSGIGIASNTPAGIFGLITKLPVIFSVLFVANLILLF